MPEGQLKPHVAPALLTMVLSHFQQHALNTSTVACSVCEAWTHTHKSRVGAFQSAIEHTPMGVFALDTHFGRMSVNAMMIDLGAPEPVQAAKPRSTSGAAPKVPLSKFPLMANGDRRCYNYHIGICKLGQKCQYASGHEKLEEIKDPAQRQAAIKEWKAACAAV